MNTMSAIAILSSLILVGVSCRPRNQSSIKHEVGSTKFPFLEPLAPCTKTYGETAVAEKYLRNIAVSIAKANPDTFKGNTDIGNFCFSAERNAQVNAFASVSGSGQVNFYSGLLESGMSDAKIAIIMSHELAHILMGHVTGARSYRLPTEMLSFRDSEYQRLAGIQSEKYLVYTATQKEYDSKRIEFDTLQLERRTKAALKSPEFRRQSVQLENDVYAGKIADFKELDAKAASLNIDDLNLNIDLAKKVLDDATQKNEIAKNESSTSGQALFDYIKKFDKRTPAEQLNWTEQEADEVGLELYLKAGYPLASAGWLFSHNSDDEDETLRICAKARNSKGILEPERQGNSHPTSCWRLYNFIKKETQSHKTEYDQIIVTASKAPPISNPSLEQALDSVVPRWRESQTKPIISEDQSTDSTSIRTFTDRVLRNINTRVKGCTFEAKLSAFVDDKDDLALIQIVGRDRDGIVGLPIHKYGRMTGGVHMMSRQFLESIPKLNYRECQRLDVEDPGFEPLRKYTVKLTRRLNSYLETCRVISLGRIETLEAKKHRILLTSVIKTDGERDGVISFVVDENEDVDVAVQRLLQEIPAVKFPMCTRLPAI